MSGQVCFVNDQVVIMIQLPEFAIDDVKMLVGKEIRLFVYVVVFLKLHERLQTTSDKSRELSCFSAQCSYV